MSEDALFVERAILCDYASIDINGKAFAMGIVSPEIFVPSNVSLSIPFYLMLTIAPKKQKFAAMVAVRNPSNKSFYKAICHYEKDSPPTEIERCHFILQLPIIQFQGFGRYVMELTEGGKVYGSFFLSVREGDMPPSDVGRIAVQLVDQSMI